MKLTFYGAARTVTGSMHLLEANGKKLLLDCGFYQGKRKESYEKNLNFPFDPKSIDAVVLSHAHIDHSGNLPNLVKRGFSGPIYCTPATADLTDIMLMDAGHIQEADVEYVNKKNKKKGLPPVEPIYTQEDAALVKLQLRAKKFYKSFEPIPGVRVELVENGHILGAAAVVMDVEETGFKKAQRVWFSGDIGRFGQPLLPDPVLPDHVQYLLMECTYGDKRHHDPEVAFDEFRKVVKQTLERGGKVIIPSFAVGRTQELVYNLNRMVSFGDIPVVPVYVDSPLAVNATDIFRKHSKEFDAESKQLTREGGHPALDFPGLVYTRSVEESKAINDKKGPLIIISASGMAEGGRILHHLKNNVEDPKNTVMIVGWQAPHTLGRRLADRDAEVSIFGEVYPLRAQVETIGGLSAHAGQDLLLRYAQSTQRNLKQVILVHGEPKGAEPLMALMKERKIDKIMYPEQEQFLEI